MQYQIIERIEIKCTLRVTNKTTQNFNKKWLEAIRSAKKHLFSIIGLCMASMTFGDHINSTLLAHVFAAARNTNLPCFAWLPGWLAEKKLAHVATLSRRIFVWAIFNWWRNILNSEKILHKLLESGMQTNCVFQTILHMISVQEFRQGKHHAPSSRSGSVVICPIGKQKRQQSSSVDSSDIEHILKWTIGQRRTLLRVVYRLAISSTASTSPFFLLQFLMMSGFLWFTSETFLSWSIVECIRTFFVCVAW